MNNIIKLVTPLQDTQIRNLHAGDMVEISGCLYSARDTAHQRLVNAMDRGEPLPFDLNGQLIYYVGPSPARPGNLSGSAGPTTAGRMNTFAPRLLENGLKGMIGKGEMNQAVAEALQAYTAVYFAAVGGAAALIAQTIISSRVIAYPELGPEAIRELIVERFSVVVAQDCYGGNVFGSGKQAYLVSH